VIAKRGRGRPGVTLEDVRQACDALAQQGRRVGPTTVRLELGRGGYGTITKHLRTLGFTRAPATRKK
jgi:hypothetical protein